MDNLLVLCVLAIRHNINNSAHLFLNNIFPYLKYIRMSKSNCSDLVRRYYEFRSQYHPYRYKEANLLQAHCTCQSYYHMGRLMCTKDELFVCRNHYASMSTNNNQDILPYLDCVLASSDVR